MKSVLAGALGLVVLQVALASPLTAPRLGQLGTDLAQLVARWTDPTVPLFGAAGKPNTGPAPTAPATPARPQSPQSSIVPVSTVLPTQTTLE